MKKIVLFYLLILINLIGCNSDIEIKKSTISNYREVKARQISKDEFIRLYHYRPERLEYYDLNPPDYEYRVDSIQHKSLPLTKYIVESSHNLPFRVVVFDTTDTYYLGYGFMHGHDQELIDNFCQVKDSLSCYKATELMLWLRTPFQNDKGIVVSIDSIIQVSKTTYQSFYTYFEDTYCMTFLNGILKSRDSLYVKKINSNYTF